MKNETQTQTPEEQAKETIADYKKLRIRSFAIINGRIWCDKSNLMEHLVFSPSSVDVLVEHYRQKREQVA